MTEEIIIDNIDVSKCEAFFKANKTCYNCYACEGSDCYFKQLKRLEQENKELKEECANLKSLIWYINCSGEIETIDCVISEYYESRNTQYEKGFWKKVCALKGKDEFKNNYRSALEEIREKIKSLNKDICNNCGWYNTDNCQPNGYVCHDLIEIQNKINEVLNA